ncbi:MAG: C39 family peptidase [Anaerolineae bacterium]|nr:C39 family peptidase [Anaerolineae bacterium]
MKKKIIVCVVTIIFLAGALLGFYYSPFWRSMEVRLDIWGTKLHTLINPVGQAPTVSAALPTPVVTTLAMEGGLTATQAPQVQTSPTVEITAETPQPTPTGIPGEVRLPSPKFELQDWNNCGPDALSLYLRFYGWQGDQFTISNEIKPLRADRNVNVDELAGYVSNHVDNLTVEYRVGGSLDLLRQLIAAGYPVLVEETFTFEQPFWFQDDLWGGHYLLLNGYNDKARTFLTQDSYWGADKYISYDQLDKNWQAFNRVYLLVFPPADSDKIKTILKTDWDADQNRQNALQSARRETQATPQNPFAWFNLGSNLVYFEDYQGAAVAYDQARALTIPQRMLRYQFGPFLAYFHSGRTDDLMSLVEYALKVTPNSEEALLWQGWGLYRIGKKSEALASFAKALDARPGYADAEYALDYVKNN